MSLRAVRTAAGLSQTELAKRIGVTQSSIADWERGKCSPRAGSAVKLARVLRCSLDDIFDVYTGKTEAS